MDRSYLKDFLREFSYEDEEQAVILAAYDAFCENSEACEKTLTLLEEYKWLGGWRAFCESVRENYENAIRGQELPETTKWKREHFAHYLDCEAHTDVWRELYKTWNETNK